MASLGDLASKLTIALFNRATFSAWYQCFVSSLLRPSWGSGAGRLSSLKTSGRSWETTEELEEAWVVGGGCAGVDILLTCPDVASVDFLPQRGVAAGELKFWKTPDFCAGASSEGITSAGFCAENKVVEGLNNDLAGDAACGVELKS